MKLIQKRDVAVVFFLLFLAALLFFGYKLYNRGKQPKAEIYYGTEQIGIVELDQGRDETFTFPQNENVVFHLYEDGSICFEQSDCPDQICIHAGRLRQAGESAACLPNEFILRLVPAEGQEEKSLDLIQ